MQRSTAAAASGLSKVKILEGIKALESGDKSATLIDLSSAQQAMLENQIRLRCMLIKA